MTEGHPAESHLWIAGVDFSLVRREVTLSTEPRFEDRGFEGPTRNAAGGECRVNLAVGRGAPPDVSTLRAPFVNEAWRLCRQGDARYVALPGENSIGAIATARLDKNVSHVTIWPGPQLRTRPDTEGLPRARHLVCYPLDQLLMMYALASRRGVLIHAAAAVLGGNAYVFAGASGAGKSTLTEALQDNGLGPDLLSDDRVVIRAIEGEFYAFGTPWAGTAKVAQNRGAPLKGIFFLAKDPENRIEVLKADEVLPHLLRVASIPWYDRDMIEPMLETCESLLRRTTTGILRFRPDAGVAEALVRFADRG